MYVAAFRTMPASVFNNPECPLCSALMKRCVLLPLLLINRVVVGGEPAMVGGKMEGRSAGEAREMAAGIVFRWCPAGTFTMGAAEAERTHHDNEKPVNVILTKGFWLGETEVTQGQWKAVMQTRPWSNRKFVQEGDDYPAVYIDAEDAVSYCEKLTNHERSADRLPKGWKYALPTEAQWEYAARSGATTRYCFGDAEASLRDHAWFNDNAGNVGEKYAHRVGLKQANRWGLKDMHGNVYEWCGDWYANELLGGRDPKGPSSGGFRVHRGGGWYGGAYYCRSAYRHDDHIVDAGTGFRLAVTTE